MGTDGARCEFNIDDCNPMPCFVNNTETCLDLVNNYTCICKNGFSGRTCEVHPENCVKNKCLNDGVCNETPSGFICTCLNGWAGTVDY